MQTNSGPRCSAFQRRWRACWCALAVLACALVAPIASAQAGRAAVYVDGPGAETVREELVRAVPPGMKVLPSAPVADALAKEGEAPGVAATHRDRAMLASKLHRVASALDVDALVIGTIVARKKGDPELHLVVTTSQSDGARVDETVVLRRNRSRVEQWRHLVSEPLAGVPARGGGPASASAATGDAVRAPSLSRAGSYDSTSEPAPRPSGAVISPETALAVGFLGLDFGARQFHYNERITNETLRPYDLPQGVLFPVAPGVRVSGELYPLAKTDLGLLRDLGVVGGVRTNAAKAQIADTTISTSWYSWDAALRLRVHTGARGASTAIGIKAGLGQEAFHFRDAGVWENLLPDVSYRNLRVGADARVPLGRFALLFAAGYRHLLSTTGPDGNGIPAAGKLGERFPQAKITGLDLQAGAALTLTPWLEGRLLVDYTRYGASLRPAVGSSYVAGGAVEQMLHAGVGVAASY